MDEPIMSFIEILNSKYRYLVEAKDAYNFLIKNIYTELCWYDTKTATNNIK